MSRPNSPLASDVVDIGSLEADVVAELNAGEFEQLPGENSDPDSDEVPRLASDDAPANPEPVESEPPPSSEEPPPADPEPPAEEPAVDKKALAAIERRDAALRASEKALEEKQAAFDAELTRVREELQSKYSEDLLRRADEVRRMENWSDRQKAEYYYKRHKASEGEPGYEESAENMRYQSDTDKRLAAIEAENRKLRETIENDRKSAAEQAESRRRQADGEKYLRDAVGEIDPQTMPNLAADLKADPIATQVAVGREIAILHRKYGELPTTKDVLVSMEKSRQEWLAARGYQPVIATPSQAPEAKPSAAKAPATISSDFGTSTSTEAEPTDIETRAADVTREIEHLFNA